MPAPDQALLAGLTVLDFTRVLAGPYCTRLLADLGARVIKVERPGEGDDTRRGHAQLEEGRTDQATYFIRINAGKSSLALDLAQPKAREVVLDVSMLECLSAAEDINYGGMLNAGAEYPGPRPGMIVHGIGGRHVAMQTVGAPQLWARLVAMMGRPELATDARFATPAARREHWAELHPIICEWLQPVQTVEEGGVAPHTAPGFPPAPVPA